MNDMTITLHPYLNFNGNCDEAMKFYQSILGGKLDMTTFAQSGMAKNPAEKDRIVHAKLESGSIVFMASDGSLDMHITSGNSVHMSLMGGDEKTLRGYWDGLSRGGHVDMPMVKQFWGDTFGMFTDKFGIHWMINISAKKA